MSTTRILGTLLLTGTFALAATGTQTSIAQPGQSQELQVPRSDEHSKTGVAVGHRRLLVWHHRQPASNNSSRSTPMEPSFARCQAKSASHRHVPPTRWPMASGVTLGKGRFGVTIWDIFYDVNTGQLLHYMKLRLEVTLGDDRDQASGRAILEVIDPQGVVLTSRCRRHHFLSAPVRAREGRDCDAPGSIATSAWNLPASTGLGRILWQGSRLGAQELGLLAKTEPASRAVDTHRHGALEE